MHYCSLRIQDGLEHLILIILRPSLYSSTFLAVDSLCHKQNFSNPNNFAIWWWKPMTFQTLIVWSNRIYSLKYVKFMTLGFKDIVIRQSEFVAKTQFLCLSFYKAAIVLQPIFGFNIHHKPFSRKISTCS